MSWIIPYFSVPELELLGSPLFHKELPVKFTPCELVPVRGVIVADPMPDKLIIGFAANCSEKNAVIVTLPLDPIILSVSVSFSITVGVTVSIEMVMLSDPE